ncbi:DNA-directed RNA polymerase subunit delta [Rummeliibacillus sp. NPDC094406]|uniref:DNA-directed RNA polymerase subunit delta n=1 Tax=Rummeliibacillus sp. NPDC094406 TaxID=3364511 RepID=UPI003813FED8
MHELNLRELNQEQLIEESLINLAYAILEEKHQPLAFAEIMQAIQDLGARTDEEMKAAAIQFYTDINIDGRFIVLGENRWGIREWYAIDQVEEETAPTVKVRKKKAKAALVDEDLEEDDEIEFEEDFDEFVDDDEEIDGEEDFDSADIDEIDDDDLDEEIEIEDEEFEIDDDDEELDDEELEDKEKE